MSDNTTTTNNTTRMSNDEIMYELYDAAWMFCERKMLDDGYVDIDAPLDYEDNIQLSDPDMIEEGDHLIVTAKASVTLDGHTALKDGSASSDNVRGDMDIEVTLDMVTAAVRTAVETCTRTRCRLLHAEYDEDGDDE